jgi:trehalose-phosphatase
VEYLLDRWSEIRDDIDRSFVPLFLDFDGTLAPIVSHPSMALLPEETRHILAALRNKEWCSVCILSGRNLSDLVGRIGIDGITYGGNHGAHLTGPSVDFQAQLPGIRDLMRTVASDFRALPLSVPGIILENKGESLSVHYRNAPEAEIPSIRDALAEVVGPYVSDGLVKAREGKMVLEVTARVWDKGKAVLWLVDQMKSSGSRFDLAPIYIGDDTTDEDAFDALGGKGVTVVVGNRPVSGARFYLDDTRDVRRFLVRLLLEGHGSSA